MCGRYVLQRDPAGLVRYFGASPPVPNHPASWNMAPTQPGLVLRRNPGTGTRHLDVLRQHLPSGQPGAGVEAAGCRHGCA